MDESKSKAPLWLQPAALILLRTLIGWQFLYEGYYKLILPAWTRDGRPLAGWSAGGFLKAASGSLAGLWTPWADRAVEAALVLIGLSLILGLLTQIGCWGALVFLSGVYLVAIPSQGIPQSGTEGVSLLVNKNLVEWAAVLVLIAFRTGQIAGLDLLLQRKRATMATAV